MYTFQEIGCSASTRHFDSSGPCYQNKSIRSVNIVVDRFWGFLESFFLVLVVRSEFLREIRIAETIPVKVITALAANERPI